MDSFLVAFVPLFIAMDPIAILPMYISLTSDLKKPKRNKLLWEATLTALIVSVAFLWTGQWLFNMLGISSNDFRIGGGIVLLLIAVLDLLIHQSDQRRSPDDEDSGHGVVPIGIPLIVGPAALTTILILVDRVGAWVTLSALLTNLVLVFFVFRYAGWVMRVMGKGGTRAFGKVASLFLVAIAVMMIRTGIENLFK